MALRNQRQTIQRSLFSPRSPQSRDRKPSKAPLIHQLRHHFVHFAVHASPVEALDDGDPVAV